MRRLLIAATLMTVTTLAVLTADAQPEGDRSPTPADQSRVRSDRPHGERNARAERDRRERWTERWAEAIQGDIAWLREQGLDRAADRMAELNEQDDRSTRMTLWWWHGRIRQLRRLEREHEDKAREAIEDIKLEYDVVDLARKVREAEGERRRELQEQLSEKLRKQFEARISAQQAIIETIEQRLARLRERVGKQVDNRDRIIDQRLHDLSNPEQPLPEPELAPPMPFDDHDGPKDRGRDRGRDQNRP